MKVYDQNRSLIFKGEDIHPGMSATVVKVACYSLILSRRGYRQILAESAGSFIFKNTDFKNIEIEQYRPVI